MIIARGSRMDLETLEQVGSATAADDSDRKVRFNSRDLLHPLRRHRGDVTGADQFARGAVDRQFTH